jgi:hypothetical protein
MYGVSTSPGRGIAKLAGNSFNACDFNGVGALEAKASSTKHRVKAATSCDWCQY